MFRRERNVITLALPRARPHGICMSRAARDFMLVEKRLVHRAHVNNKRITSIHVLTDIYYNWSREPGSGPTKNFYM